jgi:hypothetical protein
VAEELPFYGVILQEFSLIGQRKKFPKPKTCNVSHINDSNCIPNNDVNRWPLGVPFLAEFPPEGEVQGLPLGMT